MIFGQWIEARSQRKLFRWISNYHVKAFLDAYHEPLRNNHHHWPGLLLVSRALLLVFAFNAFGDPSINLLATITCIIGLQLFTGTAYNNVYLYILEEVSFLLICLLLAASACTMACTRKPTCPHLYPCGHCLCYLPWCTGLPHTDTSQRFKSLEGHHYTYYSAVSEVSHVGH